MKNPSVPLTTSKPERPDPEVPEKKARRRFTAQYKLRTLAEVDTSTTFGEIGAILRREGLYLFQYQQEAPPAPQWSATKSFLRKSEAGRKAKSLIRKNG